jgi:hypothetical protein
MKVFRQAGACAAALAIGALATLAAQGTSAFPLLLSDVTAPAIDRGLRANDPARAPRSGIGEDIIRESADGTEALRGSVIVKFRAGTPTDTQRIIAGLVDGSAPQRPSYADFEIVTIDPSADPETVARQLEPGLGDRS